jgi:GNAT superfamily N-acetyltransferase
VIEVRRAGPDDAGLLGEIHAAAWQAAYARFFDPEFVARAVQARLGRWHARIGAGDGQVLLAVLDGRAMALSYAVPSSSRPGLAEIYSFYGHPAGWGSGVAAALMTETLDRLRDDNFPGVHLWTLRDTPRSRRFYSKCGFTESGATRVHDFGDGQQLDQVEYERGC